MGLRCERGGDMGLRCERGGDMGDGCCDVCMSTDLIFLSRDFCLAAEAASGFDFTRLCPFFAGLVWNSSSTARQNHVSDRVSSKSNVDSMSKRRPYLCRFFLVFQSRSGRGRVHVEDCTQKIRIAQVLRKLLSQTGSSVTKRLARLLDSFSISNIGPGIHIEMLLQKASRGFQGTHSFHDRTGNRHLLPLGTRHVKFLCNQQKRKTSTKKGKH
jgi:hypothetical protein